MVRLKRTPEPYSGKYDASKKRIGILAAEKTPCLRIWQKMQILKKVLSLILLFAKSAKNQNPAAKIRSHPPHLPDYFYIVNSKKTNV